MWISITASYAFVVRTPRTRKRDVCRFRLVSPRYGHGEDPSRRSALLWRGVRVRRARTTSADDQEGMGHVRPTRTRSPADMDHGLEARGRIASDAPCDRLALPRFPARGRFALARGGWPIHHVKEMLGHANISQTDTNLNAARPR